MLSSVKRFVMADFWYTAKRRTEFPEPSIYEQMQSLHAGSNKLLSFPGGDASQVQLQDRIIRTFDRFRNAMKSQNRSLSMILILGPPGTDGARAPIG
jgi:hypothetical protein